MFFLSLVIINEDLQYSHGYTEFYVYGDNYTGYHWDYVTPGPPGVNEVNLFHMNRTIEYSNFEGPQSHFFGYWLAIISAIGFIMTIISLKGGFKEGE